jgi:hypothetical protein
VFVDGIRTTDDLATSTRRLGDIPLVYNGTAKTTQELAGTGISLQLHGGSLASIVGAIADVFYRLSNEQPLPTAASFADLLEILGVDDALATVAGYEDPATTSN